MGERRTVTRSTAAADSLASLGGGLAGAVPRAFGFALGALFSPLRILMGLSLLGGGANRQTDARRPIEVQSFRCRTGSANVVDCVLRGENHGGELALGDRVRVHGRRGFRGGAAVNVTKVQNLDTGAVVRPRVPFAIRYALPLALLKLALGCLVLLTLLAMCGVIR